MMETRLVNDGDWKWLYRTARPYLSAHVLGATVYLSASLLALLDPLLIKEMLDVALPSRKSGLIALVASGFLLSYAGRSCLGSVGEIALTRSAKRVLLSIRKTLLRHIGVLPSAFQDNEPVGGTIQLLTDTVDELGRLLLDYVPVLLRSLFSLASVILALFLIDRSLALYVLPVIPLFLASINLYKKRMLAAALSVQNQNGVSYSFLQEYLSGLNQVKLLNMQGTQERKATHLWSLVVRAELNSKRAEVIYALVSGVFVSVVIATGLYMASIRVERGLLTIGSLIAFYAYLSRLFEPMYFLVDIGTRMQRIRACLVRIRRVLTVPKPYECATEDVTAERGHTELIACNDLSFSYNSGKHLIRHLDLQLAQGSTLALTGESGCGKSTLGKLLVKLYEPTSGIVLFEGEKLSSLRSASVRKAVAYLQQHTVLFDGSLLDNLTLGSKSFTSLDIEKVLEVCCLFDLRASLCDGLKTRIGPAGNSVSGGERQRIAIARALLRRPRLLILDETTSGLDAAVEARLFESIRSSYPTMTMIIISHRLQSLLWVDRCLCFQNGALVTDEVWRTLRGESVPALTSESARLKHSGVTRSGHGSQMEVKWVS